MVNIWLCQRKMSIRFGKVKLEGKTGDENI